MTPPSPTTAGGALPSLFDVGGTADEEPTT
jgi:hypothetical protein